MVDIEGIEEEVWRERISDIEAEREGGGGGGVSGRWSDSDGSIQALL